jgi:hypothetical protein
MSRITLYVIERKRVRSERGRVGAVRAKTEGDGPFVSQGKQARPLHSGNDERGALCLTGIGGADSINLHLGTRFLSRKFILVTAFHETCLF